MPGPAGSRGAAWDPQVPRAASRDRDTCSRGLSPSEIRHRHLSASARGQGVTDTRLSPPSPAEDVLQLVLARFGAARVPLQGLEGCGASGQGVVSPLGRAAGQTGHRGGWAGCAGSGQAGVSPRQSLRELGDSRPTRDHCCTGRHRCGLCTQQRHAPTRAPLPGESWGRGQCPFPASSHRAGPLLASHALLCSFS